MKDKFRTDKICIVCKKSTVMVLTFKGWVCKNCNVLQTIENVKKETKG